MELVLDWDCDTDTCCAYGISRGDYSCNYTSFRKLIYLDLMFYICLHDQRKRL